MKKEHIIIGVMLLILVSLFVYNVLTDQSVVIEELKEEEVFIKVYISGEVNSPGVYTLKEDERLDSLIKKAGGFKQTALKDKINLAKKLKDGEMIVIYPISDEKEDNKKYSGLDIFNYGKLEDIVAINGIGEVLAGNILKYRNNHGFFSSFDDLINVSGIGEGKLNRIKKSLGVN